MLFTLGKIFFPTLLHREKALRARMRWVAAVFGLMLVLAMAVIIGYVQKTRPAPIQSVTPIKTQKPPR